MAAGAGGNQLGRAAHQFLQPLHIGPGIGRQLGPFRSAGGGFAPARHFRIDRLALFQQPGIRGETGYFPSADPVAGTDFDRLESVQDVQAGQHHSGKAVDLLAVAAGDGVKPAHPPGAAGGYAIFLGLFPQFIAHRAD